MKQAEAAHAGAGGLGEGGLVGPQRLVPGHHVGGAHLGRGLGGQAVPPAAGVDPPQGEGQPQGRHRRIGQAGIPGVQLSGGEAVQQGEGPGQKQKALRPGAQGKELLGPRRRDLVAHHPHQQQQAAEHQRAALVQGDAELPHPLRQRGPGHKRKLQRHPHRQQRQQQGQTRPPPLGLQALAVQGRQTARGGVRGQLPLPHHPQAGTAGGRVLPGQLLLVHAGGVFLRTAGGLVRLRLIVHMVGKVVRLPQQGMDPGPDGAAHAFRHDLRHGLVLRPGPGGRPVLGGEADGVLLLPAAGGGILPLREVHHLGPGPFRAVFRQDLLQGELPAAFLILLIGH